MEVELPARAASQPSKAEEKPPTSPASTAAASAAEEAPLLPGVRRRGERAVHAAEHLLPPRRRPRGRRDLPPHPAHAHPPSLPQETLQMDPAVPGPLLLYSIADA